jgi:hypothetical protein
LAKRVNEDNEVAGYYPRVISLTPQGQPDNGSLYELLVTGTDGIGVLSKLTKILADHNVNIIPSGGYNSLKPGTFIWTTFADFSGRSTPQQVVDDLKRLSFVGEAQAKKLDGMAFDLFLFPVYQMGRFRATIFGVKPLLAVERRLIEQFGSAGEVILFEEGKQYLIESIAQLGDAIPEGRRGVHLENILGWLRTTGWGIFEFDASNLERLGEISASIQDPPNAAVPRLIRSNFVNGVVSGVIEVVYGKKMRLDSQSYDSANRRLHLVFRESKR